MAPYPFGGTVRRPYDGSGWCPNLKNTLKLWSALRPKANECMKVWCVLLPAAILIVPAWAVILSQNINGQYCISSLYGRIVFLSNIPDEAHFFARKHAVRRIRNQTLLHFHSVEKDPPPNFALCSRNLPKVFDFSAEGKTRCITGGDLASLFHASCIVREIMDIHPAYSDIGPIGSVEGISGNFQRISSDPHLPAGEYRIKHYEYGSNLSPAKLTSILGCIFILGSLNLLFKVMDYINLDVGCKDNLAIGGFFLALALFLSGSGMFLWPIGLM